MPLPGDFRPDMDEGQLRALLEGRIGVSGSQGGFSTRSSPDPTALADAMPRLGREALKRPAAVRLLGLLGYILATIAYFVYGTFNAGAPFFEQPHLWLLVAIYAANPRALAVYYLLCAQPPVAHWFASVALGIVCVPGAWGLYVLPGLGADDSLRMFLFIAGFCLRDLGFNLIFIVKNLREAGIRLEEKTFYIAMVIVVMSFRAIAGGGWLYAMRETKVNWGDKVEHKTREAVATELGFGSYHEMIEALGDIKPEFRFWPGVVKRDEKEGFLMSESCIPLRSIAAKPNVSFFESQDRVSSFGTTGVIGVMEPWTPYFVFELDDKGVSLGDSLWDDEDARRWAATGRCFCWTTRECLNLEEETRTYASLEEAKADAGSSEGTTYQYRYKAHFIRDPDRKAVAAYRMAALPILDRKDSVYWCIAKPEGDTGGYEVCWIKWNGEDNSVTLRFRTTRVEYERYVRGIMRFERQFRESRMAIVRKGIDYTVGADISEHRDDPLNKLLEGIPKISGYLQQPPSTMGEYAQLKEKALELLKISNSPALWDCNDVAYLTLDQVY